jgi:hypothetical protein
MAFGRKRKVKRKGQVVADNDKGSFNSPLAPTPPPVDLPIDLPINPPELTSSSTVRAKRKRASADSFLTDGSQRFQRQALAVTSEHDRAANSRCLERLALAIDTQPSDDEDNDIGQEMLPETEEEEWSEQPGRNHFQTAKENSLASLRAALEQPFLLPSPVRSSTPTTAIGSIPPTEHSPALSEARARSIVRLFFRQCDDGYHCLLRSERSISREELRKALPEDGHFLEEDEWAESSFPTGSSPSSAWTSSQSPSSPSQSSPSPSPSLLRSQLQIHPERVVAPTTANLWRHMRLWHKSTVDRVEKPGKISPTRAAMDELRLWGTPLLTGGALKSTARALGRGITNIELELSEALLSAASALSFSTFSSAFWRNILAVCSRQSGATLIKTTGRQTIGTTRTEFLYEFIMGEHLQTLERSNFAALYLDGWTARDGGHITGAGLFLIEKREG